MIRAPKVAIVHYWLVRMRGGERVLEQLLRLFPQAEIYTHVYDPSAMSDLIRSHKVHTTFIDKLPASRKLYQKYLPLMPLALEQLDLSAYDLVISSESGPAKGVITRPDALHLCYCHTPMRYLWDRHADYWASAGPLSRFVMALTFPWLRVWDMASAARVDVFVANSGFIRQRIEKVYRRPARVVFPPVPVSLYRTAETIEPHYLWVGQMTPYKRADLVVEAFNALGLPLLMVGDGPMGAQVRKAAKPNICIVERLNFEALRQAYACCRALVFTAEEDFGIVPVEAMAAGRPVLAFGRGGALDTVAPGKTGLFFAEQTPESLMDGVRRLEAWLPEFDPQEAVRHAQRFAPEHFDIGIMAAIQAHAPDMFGEPAAEPHPFAPPLSAAAV